MSNKWIEVTEMQDEFPVFMHVDTGQRKIVKPSPKLVKLVERTILDDAFKRAMKVLRDEDAAQDFAIEIWKDIAKGREIRHLGGYMRLRLRKAIARKYSKPDTEILACELSDRPEGDPQYMEQDERLAELLGELGSEDGFNRDYEGLTPYQLDIVHLLEAGYSAPTIASLFDVYPRTIYDQIKAMKEARLNGDFGPTKYIARHNPLLPQVISRPVKNRYVYAYMRLNGEPYYIGKGTIRRVYSKEHPVKLPPDPRNIHILSSGMSDADARQAEMFFIYIYGRRDEGTGCLYNQTDGADGPAFNSKLSALHDDGFYEDNPSFRLIEGDGYWYSETYPYTETNPKPKQMPLKFPVVDPYYTKRMAERAEAKEAMERIKVEWQVAVESGNFNDQIRLSNEFSNAKAIAA